MFEVTETANLKIDKAPKGGTGSVKIFLGSGWEIEFTFPQFIPFTKSDVTKPFSVIEENISTTIRQKTFEHILESYCGVYDVVPFRFFDQTGKAWKLETTAADLAVRSGKFEWVSMGKDTFSALKLA
jgi:hypothetical protein